MGLYGFEVQGLWGGGGGEFFFGGKGGVGGVLRAVRV